MSVLSRQKILKKAVEDFSTARRPKSTELLGGCVPSVIDLSMMNMKDTTVPLSFATQTKSREETNDDQEEEKITSKIQDEHVEGNTEKEWAELERAKMDDLEERKISRTITRNNFHS